MVLRSKRVAMIMVMGLLVAGLVGRLPHLAAQESSIDRAEKAINAARSAQSQATKMLNTMMSHMDSMKNMQMTSMEKEMYNAMHDMAMTMKMLLDANRQLINSLQDLLAAAKEKRG